MEGLELHWEEWIECTLQVMVCERRALANDVEEATPCAGCGPRITFPTVSAGMMVENGIVLGLCISRKTERQTREAEKGRLMVALNRHVSSRLFEDDIGWGFLGSRDRTAKAGPGESLSRETFPRCGSPQRSNG